MDDVDVGWMWVDVGGCMRLIIHLFIYLKETCDCGNFAGNGGDASSDSANTPDSGYNFSE